MKIDEIQWEINKNQWNSIKFNKDQWKSIKINKNQWNDSKTICSKQVKDQ